MVKFSDHSEILEFRAFFQYLHNPYFHLDCHLISHSPTHLTPLTLPLTTAGHVSREGTPHPHTIARKPSTSTKIPLPLYKSQTINSLHLQISPFSHFFTKRTPPKIPSHLLHQTLISSPPTSRTSRTHLELHHKDTTFNHQPPRQHQAPTSSNQASTTHGLKPPPSPWIKLQLNPPSSEYLTHQDLVSFLITCNKSPCSHVT